MKDLLEILTIIAFFAGVCTAENIPVCATCFIVCFALGTIVCRMEGEE